MLIATKLCHVEGRQIADANKRLARLARRIERKKLRPPLNIIRHGIMVACIDMDEATFPPLKLAMQCYEDKMPGRRFVVDHFSSLNEVWSWVDELRWSGFIGVVVALVWWWCDMKEGEFDQWVSTEKYTEVHKGGIIWVRDDCLDTVGDFSEHFGPIIHEGLWRRLVVFANRGITS
ncbi:hypothetical protein M0R45_036019 [Rubus argutus]|uniref:Uncharacterized protein n=1 Tax=Rubus argutus TaxID=59490 RepID=A0AAW1VYK5_RUBAR